jgi:hypothetical protein
MFSAAMNSGSCSQKESPASRQRRRPKHRRIWLRGALARRDVVSGAIRLLESERAQGFTVRNDTFLLTYLYCLNGRVEKAETLATAAAGSTS